MKNRGIDALVNDCLISRMYLTERNPSRLLLTEMNSCINDGIHVCGLPLCIPSISVSRVHEARI